MSTIAEQAWLDLAQETLAPTYRLLRASVNSLRRLPSDAGYSNLLTACAAAAAALPVVSEISAVAAEELVVSVLEATEGLQQQISDAERLIGGESRRIAELLSLAADDTLASSYSSDATRESERADRWRIATVVALIAVIAVAALTVVTALRTTVDAAHIAGRFGLLVAVGGFAGYLQRQSNIHRQREGTAKAAELKLRTIGPFSANLPVAEAARIRMAVGLSLLAQLSEPADTTAEGDPNDGK